MTPPIASKSLVFTFADVTVREREFAIVKAGQVQQVEPKAFRLLLILIRNPNKLIAKEELLNSVWGETAVTENSLARNIALLRRLLGDDPREPRFIETVSGIGYRFICPVEVSEELAGNGAGTQGADHLSPNGKVAEGANDGSAVAAAAPQAIGGTGGTRLRVPITLPARETTQEATKGRWPLLAKLEALVFLVAIIFLVVVLVGRRSRTPSQAAWVQITNFPDSATSPALSPDGHMLAFIRGPDTFVSYGQIYIKMLPDGQPVKLTNDDLMKSSPAFSPDGSRIAYTTVDQKNWQWNTWVIPVLGGEPKEFLPNAASLTWLDRQQVLFSELKSEFRMSIATATESRADEREIYLPAADNGMAHRSWISPDGRWMLVVEMDYVGFQPCRVLPFDGSSTGWIVGPKPARCRTAGWSPDGRTMYFGADAGDGYHIWRQRFPQGVAEQMTFGATQEEGIAMAPDGHSLITSAGFVTSTVWVHDAAGDRQVSGEGFATVPGLGHPDDPWVHDVFSPDGSRLYFLLRKPGSRAVRSGELWVANLKSGRTEVALPGVLMGKFDILPDGERVVFEAQHEDGAGHVWVAWLDRRMPPKMLTMSVARLPHFGAGGKIYMGVREGNQEFTYAGGPDETPHKLDPPFPGVIYISPHGEWLLDGFAHLTARPAGGGSPIPVCDYCSIGWKRGVLYVALQVNGEIGGGKVLAVQLPDGKDLPELPPSGLKSVEDFKGLHVLAEVDMAGARGFSPGPDPTTYAYVRTTTQRNLFRIPLN